MRVAEQCTCRRACPQPSFAHLGALGVGDVQDLRLLADLAGEGSAGSARQLALHREPAAGTKIHSGTQRETVHLRDNVRLRRRSSRSSNLQQRQISKMHQIRLKEEPHASAQRTDLCPTCKTALIRRATPVCCSSRRTSAGHEGAAGRQRHSQRTRSAETGAASPHNTRNPASRGGLTIKVRRKRQDLDPLHAKARRFQQLREEQFATYSRARLKGETSQSAPRSCRGGPGRL